jgi:hypothetical protein
MFMTNAKWSENPNSTTFVDEWQTILFLIITSIKELEFEVTLVGHETVFSKLLDSSKLNKAFW